MEEQREGEREKTGRVNEERERDQKYKNKL